MEQQWNQLILERGLGVYDVIDTMAHSIHSRESV